MKVVAVAKLKASLSRYLSAVKVGEEVLITERSRPIAKIIPIPPAQDDEEQRLRRLEAQGILRMQTRKLPKNFWDLPRPADPEGKVLKALLEERRQGR